MTFIPKTLQIKLNEEKHKGLRENLLYIQNVTGVDTRNAVMIACMEYANELLRKRNGTQYIPKKKRIESVAEIAESNIATSNTDTTIKANIKLCGDIGVYNEEDNTCSVVMYSRTDNPYVIAKQTRDIPIDTPNFEDVVEYQYYHVTEKEIETLQDEETGAALRIEDHDSKAEEA